jgi:hypothetical protein
MAIARYANSVAPQLSFVLIFAHAGSENDHATAEFQRARMSFAALSAIPAPAHDNEEYPA